MFDFILPSATTPPARRARFGRASRYRLTGRADPAAVEGSEEQRLKAFKDAALILRRRIELFLSLPLQRLDAMSLQRELRNIGQE